MARGIRHRSLVGLRFKRRTTAAPIVQYLTDKKPELVPTFFVKASEPIASGVTHTVQKDLTKARPIIRVSVLGQAPPAKGLLKPISEQATKVKYGPGYDMVKQKGFKDGGGLGSKLQGLSSPVDGVTYSRWPGDTSGLGAYSSHRAGRYSLDSGLGAGREGDEAANINFRQIPPPEGL